MAITLTIAVGQTGGSNEWISDETLAATLNLRASPYSSATYSANSHLGDGIYDFLSVASGEYKVYNGSTELTKFGIIKVGEDGAALKAGTETITGSWTFSGENTFSNATAPIKTDIIKERTADAGVTIDGIWLKDSLTASNIPGLDASNSFTGATNTFTKNVVFYNDATYYPKVQYGENAADSAPTEEKHLTPKFYVDGLVAAINVAPYQQASNKRRVNKNGTVEAGKVYDDIADAISNFGVPTSTSRLLIMLEKGQSDSNYSDVFQVAHSDLATMTNGYCVIRGDGRYHSHLLLGAAGDSASFTLANLTFENMQLYCTTTDISGDRTYNSINFVDCDLWLYGNATFTNCNFWNCKVYSSNTKTVTITGTGRTLQTVFAQSVTETTYTGDKSYVDSVNTNPTMPTAPNLSA